jgi:hypothetical protein
MKQCSSTELVQMAMEQLFFSSDLTAPSLKIFHQLHPQKWHWTNQMVYGWAVAHCRTTWCTHTEDIMKQCSSTELVQMAMEQLFFSSDLLAPSLKIFHQLHLQKWHWTNQMVYGWAVAHCRTTWCTHIEDMIWSSAAALSWSRWPWNNCFSAHWKFFISSTHKSDTEPTRWFMDEQ